MELPPGWTYSRSLDSITHFKRCLKLFFFSTTLVLHLQHPKSTLHNFCCSLRYLRLVTFIVIIRNRKIQRYFPELQYQSIKSTFMMVIISISIYLHKFSILELWGQYKLITRSLFAYNTYMLNIWHYEILNPTVYKD